MDQISLGTMIQCISSDFFTIWSPPPPKLKKAFLGSVPYLNNLKPIAEEDEEAEGMEEEGSDHDVDTNNVDEEEEDMEEEDDDDTGKKKGKNANYSNNFTSQDSNKKKTSATNRNKSNKLHELTQNLEFVVKKITGSAAWQQEFKQSTGVPIRQERLSMQCSVMKACSAQFYLNPLIPHSGKQGMTPHPPIYILRTEHLLTKTPELSSSPRTGLNTNKPISCWATSRKSSSPKFISLIILSFQPFKLLTKQMEGDGPTEEGGSRGLRDCLSSKVSKDDNENGFFDHFWPEKTQQAQSLLEMQFIKQEASLKKSHNNVFDLFNAPPNSAESKELEVYIKNMDHLAGPAAKDPKSLWNVCHLYFQVICVLILIYIYLLIIGKLKEISCPIILGQRLLSQFRSCAAEKTFLSASDVWLWKFEATDN
ncbi:hypothetical protein VP01_5111g2 [Puccinia sorghi]|uniref:Uncharacterized protein n=1 Tax=Puccinia sorghi TaxID=27349 RepID=A0A0L6ULV6_9BASI|nr:hypothetical protein VP01_5111g2 [Puccinia sorghi]